MTDPRPTRRRAIGLIALGGGLTLAALGSDARSTVAPVRWRGAALGARAGLTVFHPDPVAAEKLIAIARAELARLERIFSLYRADSALTRLNRDGVLAGPPLDLVELLARAQLWGARTGGAFDVTVQPLWRLYRDHFAQPGADPAGPDGAAIARARALIDYGAMEVAAGRIRLARPGMAVTLNGIAQGDISDRVADRLKAAGAAHVLVDLGEIVAIGGHPGGRPWRVGLAQGGEIDLADRAVATSAANGFSFDQQGRLSHILDPRTGRPARGLRAASVVARRAADADALSTALLVDKDLATGDLPPDIDRIVL